MVPGSEAFGVPSIEKETLQPAGTGPGHFRSERYEIEPSREGIRSIRARWYGRWKNLRASFTAIGLAASRLKNHTPGSRPREWT